MRLFIGALLASTAILGFAQSPQTDQEVGATIANQGKRVNPTYDAKEANAALGTGTAQAYGGVPNARSIAVGILNRTVAATLKCNPIGEAYYAAGLAIRTTGCTLASDKSIYLMKVDVCGASLVGGDCSANDWISIPYYIGPTSGQPYYSSAATTPQFSVKFQFTGVCDTTSCPVNIITESFLATSGNTLHSAGVDNQQQGNNTMAQQAGVVNNPQYVAQLNQTSGQFKNCQAAVQNAVNSDQVFSSCDGTNTEYVGSGCRETDKCVNSTTQTRNWIEKCQTEVPTVRRDCNTLTPTRTCNIIKSQQECSYEMATKSCPIGTCDSNQQLILGYLKVGSDATNDYFAQTAGAGRASCAAPVPTVPGLTAPYARCAEWDGTTRCDKYFMGYCIKLVEARTCPEYSKKTCDSPAFPACSDVYASPALGTAAAMLSAPKCPAPLTSNVNTGSCKAAGPSTCKTKIGTTCVEEIQKEYCPGLQSTVCFSPTPPIEPVVCKPIPEASGCRDKAVLDPTTGVFIPADPRISPASGSLAGICLNNWTSEGCYAGKPESCIQSKPNLQNPQNCVLDKQTCVTEVLGVCGTVEQQYKCSETKTNCTAFQKETVCNGTLTKGTEKQPVAPVNNSFAQSAAAMGVAESIQKSKTQGAIRIFDGDALTCKKPTWILNASHYLANDCCRRDLEKTNPGKPLHKCTEDAVKMASARRANRTYPLGDYCSSKKPWPFGCQERAQVDCVYSSLLAKDVQIGGRKQLLELASGGANQPNVSNANFTYYAGANYGPVGNWTETARVGGRLILAYQWPSYCATAELESAYMKDNANALVCNAGLRTYFAVCNNPELCALADKMPQDPRSGATDWTITGVDPLVNDTTPLTPDVAIKGGCVSTTGMCNYQVSTWSRGGISIAYAQAEMVFEQGAGNPDNQITVGLYQFYPVWKTGSTNWILNFTDNTSNSSQSQSLDLPLDIAGPGRTIPNTGIQTYGACNQATKICRFVVRIPVPIKPKPWGTPEHPSCEGFTVEEISVLDFSKIDLSEFVATVKASAPDSSSVMANAQTTLGKTIASQQNGVAKADSGGSSMHILKISPEEVSGCFEKTEPNCQRGLVTLTIPANWPEWTPEARNRLSKQDLVIQAMVSWGDNRPTTVMIRKPNTDVFVAEHSYWEQGVNVQHEITVNIATTKSGGQWVKGYVNNFTKDPSKGAGLGLNPTGQGASSYSARQINPSINTPSGVSGNNIPVPKPGS